MFRLLLTIIYLSLFATKSWATETIPNFLVGVWATDASVLKGPLLFEGQAIYLGEDGVGAAVGGPPPIGFKIVATFDPKTNLVEYDIYEGKQRGPHGSLKYDPINNTIDSGTPKHEPMHRRFDTITDDTKKSLGIF